MRRAEQGGEPDDFLQDRERMLQILEILEELFDEMERERGEPPDA